MKAVVVWEHVVVVDESGNVKEERWKCLAPAELELMVSISRCLEKLEASLLHAIEEPSFASWYVEIALEWSAIVKKLILEVLDSKY